MEITIYGSAERPQESSAVERKKVIIEQSFSC
jgi:hypothetical protein